MKKLLCKLTNPSSFTPIAAMVPGWLVCLLFLLPATAGFSQTTQTVTVAGKGLPLEKVFSQIEKQTGFTFWYDYDQVNRAKPVDLSLRNVSIETAMQTILADQPFRYSIQNKVIVIRQREDAASGTGSTPVPPVELRGRVTGDEGEILPGAVIALKGSGKVAVANDRGEFTLTVEPAEASLGTLIVSNSGYVRRELRIGNRKELVITLEKNIQAMKDVVIANSYSRPKRKEEVVGSIATVTSKELQASRPFESIDKMLEGLAPGVQVITNTELGTPVRVNIRGQNSLTNLFSSNQTQLTTSSQPLYIIDGIPVVEQRRGDEPIAFINNEQMLNPLAGLNPDDVESISILKDAAATSIYGANASNGVIIITTKRGKAGRTRASAGYSYGWSRPINQIKWLSGPQYHELVRELYINQGRDTYTAEVLAGPRDIDTKWFELTNRYGRYHNLDFEVSGGGEQTQFRLSGSYLTNEAIQKGNDYRNISFRLRVDHALSRKLQLNATIAPSFLDKNGLNIYSVVPIIPNVPVYNADSTFFQLSSLNVPNPLAVLEQNVDNHSGGGLNARVGLDFQLNKTLRFTSQFGIDGLINKQNTFQSPKNATGATRGGFAEIYDRTNFNWINYNQVNWTPTFGVHKLDITAGFEAQSQTTKLLMGNGTGFTYYRLNELSYAQSNQAASSRQTSNSYSVYGQAQYNFNDRYVVQASGRYDGASIFGPDINSTVNAAIGLGWNLTAENFMQKQTFIDLLRIRGSYGTTGNSRIGSYQAKGIYSFSNTGYNGMTSSSPSTAPNPDLSWEKAYKLNLGLDFNFARRFRFTAEYYQNIVDDAISSVEIPVVSGFSRTLANVAKMRNRGFDLQFAADIIQSPLFKWTSILNLGYNQNMILEVKNNSYQYSSNTNASLLRAGVSTSTIWGFRYAGVDPQSGTPLYYDNKGTATPISQLDRSMVNAYKIGDRLPDAQGGWINNFTYKALTLSVILSYSFGGDDLISYHLEADGNNITNRNGSVNLMDRWQKPGDVTMIPKLSLGIPVVNSTRYLYDASFIKLNNVSLSYTLSNLRFLRGMRTTVFVNGTNLAYWYKSKSPEGRNGYREYRFGNFPEAQTLSWGARFNF